MSRSLSFLTLFQIACSSALWANTRQETSSGRALYVRSAPTPLKDDMEDQNGPAQSEPTSQPSNPFTPPTIAPGLEKKELRQKMIEILASTANGCLQELGYYPGIHAKLQQLEKRASDWQGENVKLFNDNKRLFAVVNQQKQLMERLQAEDQKKATAIQQLQVANAALNKQVEDLEAALLKKGPPGSAEYFNHKYNSLVKEYQALSGEHAQTVRLLQMQRNQSNAALTPQQVQQAPQNVQQSLHVQSSQQQQQLQLQKLQQQISTQHLPRPGVPSHSNASIFTSLSSQPAHHPPHQQNVVYQQQMQSLGTSSNRRPSGSMPGPSEQLPVKVQDIPYPNMQQRPISGQVQQHHALSAGLKQPLNANPNGPSHPPQHANTYPIAPLQSAQRPQPHPQPQATHVWTSSPLQAQPAGVQSQSPQGLWVNTSAAQGLWISTSNTTAQVTSSPRTTSSPQTPVPIPNSAPFPPVSPHNSQFGRSSATPNAPSRPSSLSQASSPFAPPITMPQNQPLNAQTPSHSLTLKRNSPSISDMPDQTIDDVSHKRPRIDGPPQVPKDISGLPSPMTPSMQHVHTMSGSVPPPPPSAHHLQSSPLTAQRSPELPVEVKQPINPPVTPAQSQSPQPSKPVEQLSKQEIVPEAEGMAVDFEQPNKPDSAEASMEEDATEKAGKDDDDDGEIVQVGPDGLRLVSDCLDELFGTDRTGTFICKFCVVRHKMNLMSGPPVIYESPSDEALAQHLMADHKAAWDRARAVDD
ncbi:hypothetical protein D9619_000493 [Psilocybe cf. subviscida]|uniref:Inhibitor of growth protein N-terminal histone-binding domain-containing protein n=1 Tax=Psilocybe cf. subviscida TaxID=2480587 RepID=A0A8H5F3F4_9AGAR|nr:hypothetical protein D9619_000493 [Psilocybe cf. subviscida]